MLPAAARDAPKRVRDPINIANSQEGVPHPVGRRL